MAVRISTCWQVRIRWQLVAAVRSPWLYELFLLQRDRSSRQLSLPVSRPNRVTDMSQDGIDPDPDNDNDPTDNNDPTPAFRPSLFDPPFGISFVDDNGLPVLRWTMVWINVLNIVAVNPAVSDGIPLGTTYAGGLSCTVGGSDDHVKLDVRSQWFLSSRAGGVDRFDRSHFGATDAATAYNELYIRFNVTVRSYRGQPGNLIRFGPEW